MTKRFLVSVDVSAEFDRQHKTMADALARAVLEDKLSEPLIGPRGGRYASVGEPKFWVVYDAFRDVYVHMARTSAKYVRPHREAK